MKDLAMRRMILATVAMGLLAGCSGDRGLRQLSVGNGPDEFSVMPSRPLQIPESLSLPDPDAQSGNRADLAPRADAIVALGGDPARAFAGGIPARDSVLVAQVNRFGTSPDIRETLAAEDQAFRNRAGVFNVFNVFGGDRYFDAYARQALDAYAELARFAALGVAVPSAPPAP